MNTAFKVALLPLVLGLVIQKPVFAESITVVSWGGAYTKSQVEAYHKPFTEKTGIEVISENYSGGLAQIKAQVEAGNVTWDLVDLSVADSLRGCDEGLLEELDHSVLPSAPDGTPASSDFLEGSLLECGVGNIVWSTIYAFDKNKIAGKTPKTIVDFFDIKSFPGKRGLNKDPSTTLEMALMGDGVPVSQVYQTLSTEAGIRRAFEMLDSIKEHTIWWETGSQPVQLLASGEVTMTMAWNGRIFDAQAMDKKPFEIIWDGQIWGINSWAIPKGSSNKANAMKFIAFSTDTQRLADQASYISYGPTRRSAVQLIGTHKETGIPMAPHMPTTSEHMKNALQINVEWWADHMDELTERFNNWLVK